MKRVIITAAMVITIAAVSSAQCNTLFSYAAYFNIVSFLNQSSVSNAHYFWNFGDGTGSNLANPVHTFPGNGNYIVTLFAKDTVSNCSSYYEYWVDVTKYSNNMCQPSISDSINNNNLYIYNTSANCNAYNVAYSGGTSCDLTQSFMPIGLSGWQFPFRMVCDGQYYDSNRNLEGIAFKTAYFDNYSSSHNYGACSANFEFKVIYQDTSNAKILFTAMSKTAKSYEWHIYGFGNPIISHNDTISEVYSVGLYCPWIVGLMVEDSSGCRDTIYQDIIVGDSSKTFLGVNNLKDKIVKVSVYPNPNNGIFTLSLSNVNSVGSIQVYNVLGENIYQTKVNSNNTEINLSGQPQGIYLYRVITETGRLIGEGKVVIQK